MAEILRPRQGGFSDIGLASEALVCLVLAGLALRVVSFPDLANFAGRRGPARRSEPDCNATGARVGWAVAAAARRAPWGPRCFERGLAAHVMLRRRGEDSRLCYGARSDGERGPAAHVWVRLGDETIVGGDEAGHYALLAMFPLKPDAFKRNRSKG
jgi:hypothetical protein